MSNDKEIARRLTKKEVGVLMKNLTEKMDPYYHQKVKLYENYDR